MNNINFIPENINLTRYLNLHESNTCLMQALIDKSVEEVILKRDKWLILELEKNGFIFTSKEDFNKFLESRCIIKQNKKLNRLYVDGEPICEWWDTIRSEVNGDRFTIVLGDMPSNCEF